MDCVIGLISRRREPIPIVTGAFDTNSVPVFRNLLQRRPGSTLVEAVSTDLADLVIMREAFRDPTDAGIENRLMRHQHKSAQAVRRSRPVPLLQPSLFLQSGLDCLVDLRNERVVTVKRVTDDLLERRAGDYPALSLVLYDLDRVVEIGEVAPQRHKMPVRLQYAGIFTLIEDLQRLGRSRLEMSR